MRRRMLALLTVALLVLAGAPVAADHAADTSRLYVAERTTDGPATLVVGGGYGYGGLDGPSDGLIALVATRDVDGEIVAADFGTVLSDGGDHMPYAYANGERIDCGATGTCDLVISGGATGMTISMDDDGGEDVYTRVFVAVHGYGASASLGSGNVGWSLREVDPTFTFARAEDSQALGARSNLVGGAEAFLSATAAGGEFGSVAVGQPPCSFPLFSPGAGATQLLGGATEPLHVCPAEFWGVADFATGATEWSLQGAAVGSSVFHDVVRLVVIDLPAPCESAPEGCPDH